MLLQPAGIEVLDHESGELGSPIAPVSLHSENHREGLPSFELFGIGSRPMDGVFIGRALQLFVFAAMERGRGC